MNEQQEQQQEEVSDFKYEDYPEIVKDVFDSILSEREPLVNPPAAEVPVIPVQPAPAPVELVPPPIETPVVAKPPQVAAMLPGLSSPRVENVVPRKQSTAVPRPKPPQTEQWQRVSRQHRFKFDAVKPQPKPQSKLKSKSGPLWQKKTTAPASSDMKISQPEKVQPTPPAKVIKAEASAETLRQLKKKFTDMSEGFDACIEHISLVQRDMQMSSSIEEREKSIAKISKAESAAKQSLEYLRSYSEKIGQIELNAYYPEQVAKKAAELQTIMSKEILPVSPSPNSVAQVEPLHHEDVKAADAAVPVKSTHSSGFKVHKSSATQRKKRALKRKNTVAEPLPAAAAKNKPLLPEPVVPSTQQIENAKRAFEECLKKVEKHVVLILPYRTQAQVALLSDKVTVLKAIQEGLKINKAELRRGIVVLQDLVTTIPDDETWETLGAIKKIVVLMDKFSIDYDVQDELETETYSIMGDSDLDRATQLFREFRERRKGGGALASIPPADAKTEVPALGAAAAQRGLFGDAKRTALGQTNDTSLQESPAEVELLRQEKQVKKIMRGLVGHINSIIALRDQCFTAEVAGNVDKLMEIASELRVVKVKMATEMDQLTGLFEEIDCTVEMNDAFWRIQEIVELVEKFTIEFEKSSRETGVVWSRYLGSGSCVTAKNHLETFHAWSNNEYAPAALSSAHTYQR